MTFALAAATTPVSTEVPSQPVGTTPTTIPGVTLQLYTAQRTSSTDVLLVFGLTIDASAASATGTALAIINGLSANGTTNGVSNAIRPTVSGASLFDPAGLKQYLTYMSQPSSDGSCLCSLIPSANLGTAGTYYFAALVAAPPSSVTSVSFITPMATITRVSLTG